jgi:hypothetical protein
MVVMKSQSVSLATLGNMQGLSISIDSGPFSTEGHLTEKTAQLLNLEKSQVDAINDAEKQKREGFDKILANLKIKPAITGPKMVLEIPDLAKPCHDLDVAWDKAVLAAIDADRKKILLRLLNGTLDNHALGAGTRTITITKNGSEFDIEDKIQYPEGESRSTSNEHTPIPDDLKIFKPLIPVEFGGTRAAEDSGQKSEF